MSFFCKQLKYKQKYSGRIVYYLILFLLFKSIAIAKEIKLAPIKLKLPKPMFIGTPQNLNVKNLQKPLGRPRPVFLAPMGTKNVALGKKCFSSDDFPVIGEIEMITDGDKNGDDGNFVELGPFLQDVTIDLGMKYKIFAIVFWHYHKQPRVYFDVIVQLGDNREMTKNVNILFNNDIDNSAGMGLGEEMHYVETSEGKLIDTKGVNGRFVKLFSQGNTNNDLNHYIEVSVYGIPLK